MSSHRAISMLNQTLNHNASISITEGNTSSTAILNHTIQASFTTIQFHTLLTLNHSCSLLPWPCPHMPRIGSMSSTPWATSLPSPARKAATFTATAAVSPLPIWKESRSGMINLPEVRLPVQAPTWSLGSGLPAGMGSISSTVVRISMRIFRAVV